MIRGESKVTRAHLERTAIVYVRQSTLMQVREHTESTLRQYDLARQAARLGWAAGDIEVIDADLGLSGRSASHRDGFKQLVARVCLGEAGAVFGLEVSRLARSNADLARLLELARLTSTLVIDNDGVYDLSDINDRLLLGLKSQMSEAELHWLTSRMNEAKRAAARRGELRVPLPVGFVYDDEDNVVIDPDEEVAAAISDVFAAFTATGSAYGVAGAFAGRRFPRRAYGGVWAGQLRWGRLTHARAAGILRNPVYAGAYVFGRRRSRQVVHPDGSVHSSVTELPRDQWEVLIPGHHPGYITWEAYLAERGEAGRQPDQRRGPPAPRGHARCARASCSAAPAAARCRSATRTATPAMSAPTPAPTTSPRRSAGRSAPTPSIRPSPPRCWPRSSPRRSRWRWPPPRRSPPGGSGRSAPPSWPSSGHVTTPTGPNVPSWPASRKTGWSPAPWRPGGKPGSPAWPTPRPRSPPSAPPSPSCPALTSSPSPSPTCPPCGPPRPPATRTASGCCAPCSADVTITPSASDPAQISVGLRWKSGASQQVQVTRRRSAVQLHCTDPAAIELARRIGPGLDNNTLAGALNDAGHRTGTGQPFDGVAAGNLRSYHHIPYPGLLEAGELTPRQVAQLTGVSTGTIHYWINAGYLTARRGPAGRWCIPFPPDVEAACRDRAAGSRPPAPRHRPGTPPRTGAQHR